VFEICKHIISIWSEEELPWQFFFSVLLEGK
jgi:hypothetical protein